ncbi:MAG: M15 family metallopeptidase [Oscillospiraceae bacterium]|nr:M15 family metallopeptidase [Oscillospiraceae bacterium]
MREPEPMMTLSPPDETRGLPEGFSYVTDINPNIAVELRYAGKDNFTGSRVDGYLSGDAAILATEAAKALSDVQKKLEEQGIGLLIYDAYRPQKASDFFVEWSKSGEESRKEEQYPGIAKRELFSRGFIAERSAHSRGCAVDVTLIYMHSGECLDMGCEFDYFDRISSHGANGITYEQAENRKLLKVAMQDGGFQPYSAEWWHYEYENESFPDTYFDFDVRGA